MDWEQFFDELFDFVLSASGYSLTLLGSVALWLAITFATRANRLSLFVFSLSAWFAVLWASIAVLLIATSRPSPDPARVAFIVLAALPGILFLYCAVRAAMTFGLKQPLELEVDRGSWLLGVLLVGHILAYIFLGVIALTP